MVRGIMYFDFGAKMLGKMLTEENDSTSLTSFFFILFENASIASRVRGGIRYALHFFLKIHLILRVGIWFGFD